jgi:WD40 repeat protein/transcriptional regulator with XRE-family HTH domain
MPISIPSNTLEKFTNFGDLLRFLRRRVSLTQMELANMVGYSHTQISRLEQNLRLPDISTIESGFVFALGIEDEPKVVARLLELAANVRREDAPSPGLCPYKGLNFYDESDAELFVGRETLTAQLVDRVLALTIHSAQSKPPDSDAIKERFLAIVGASGSGKSSLVRAGLVPALRWNKTSADWISYVFTPTEHPLESLAFTLTQENGSSASILAQDMAQNLEGLQDFVSHHLGLKRNVRLMLVIDQFEELFALCRSEEERASFIGNLLTVSADADASVVVIITLRADFYAHCANYPWLREALARNQVYIGAMNHEELCRAIEEPARRGRWEFEPGLVDLLLHDVGHEPGALPLLSHALLETWQRRRNRTMTLSGYTSSGGVHGAIAETAETVYTDQFTREQQVIARRIFLRLTEFSDEASISDTRRRATFSELVLKPEEAGITHAVLNALADARLITTSEDAAEVAHEALIREWPTLRGWLEENRDGLRLHRQLTQAAQEWNELNRSEDILFRGARLSQVREWATMHALEMNVLEHEFLEASQAWADRDAAEREAQRQRELEAMQKLAETEHRSAKQLRRRAIYLAGALLIMIFLAATAIFLRNQAETEKAISTSRELAAAAISNLDDDPERSILLALQAESTYHTIESENALHRSIMSSRVRLVLHHNGPIWSVTFSPDGTHIATASQDKTTKVWDSRSGKLLLTLVGHSDSVNSVSYSPDGNYIATASDDHTAKVWDAATGNALLILKGHTDAVDHIVFSPDGLRLVTASYDGTAKIWDATSGKELITFSAHEDIVWDVVFSPDGNLVASSGKDGNVRLWDSHSGKELFTLPVGHNATILLSVAFSQDGSRLAVGSDNVFNRVIVWDANTGQVVLQGDMGYSGTPFDLVFSPDGKLGATAGENQKVNVWDAISGKVLFTLAGHTGTINCLAFSPDGKYMATASDDGTTRIWEVTLPKELAYIPFVDSNGVDPTHLGWGWQMDYSPDGTQLITDYMDHDVRIWDASSGKELLKLKGFEGNYYPDRTFFSPDGKLAAAGGLDLISNDKTITDRDILVWDAQTGKQIVRLVGLEGFDQISFAFSPDGTHLAGVIRDNGKIIIWDIKSAKEWLTIEGPPSGILWIAYSPDGRQFVTGHKDGNAIIWDATTGEKVFTLAQNEQVSYVSYSPDGKRVALSSLFGTISLWDASTGKELLRFKAHKGWIGQFAFSPDGKYLATVSVADGLVRMWDASTGVNQWTLPVDNEGVGGVAFNPDGKYLAVGANSGIYSFIVPIRDLITYAKSRVTRPLTLEECQKYLHIQQCLSNP